MRNQVLALALLAVLAAGFTDCEHFAEVRVPVEDTTDPEAIEALWVRGDYEDVDFGGNPIEYHLAPGETVVAVSAGHDRGGLQELTMVWGAGYTCCKGSACTVTQPDPTAETETQPGVVDSWVSNGIWLYRAVELPTCSSGATLKSFHFAWFTRAKDFHGNRTDSRFSKIVYP